jgi:hypothetical protein
MSPKLSSGSCRRPCGVRVSRTRRWFNLRRFAPMLQPEHRGIQARLVPHIHDKASDTVKAFVHLFIQRQCIGDEDQELIGQLTKKSKTPLNWRRYESDPDLESTLGLVDKLLGRDVTIPWTKFVLSPNRHSCLSHILLYRASDTTRDLGTSRRTSLDLSSIRWPSTLLRHLRSRRTVRWWLDF